VRNIHERKGQILFVSYVPNPWDDDTTKKIHFILEILNDYHDHKGSGFYKIKYNKLRDSGGDNTKKMKRHPRGIA
jgi:hypothetical protein